MTQSSTHNTPTHLEIDTDPAMRAPTRIVPRSVRLLGFWSALGLAITYSLFDLGLIAGPSMLGLLMQPWDPIIPIGASLLIAPSFLLLMISIHYAATQSAKIWTHTAISFATVYASLVSLVYVTWLFVVEPRLLNGTESRLELLVFKLGSFMQMVDGIAYTFMAVAALFATPLHRGQVWRGGPAWCPSSAVRPRCLCFWHTSSTRSLLRFLQRCCYRPTG
jgi:hypothetical protein